MKVKIINVRGENWIIDLAKRRLINLENKKRIRKMNLHDFEYFQDLSKKLKQIDI